MPIAGTSSEPKPADSENRRMAMAVPPRPLLAISNSPAVGSRSATDPSVTS